MIIDKYIENILSNIDAGVSSNIIRQTEIRQYTMSAIVSENYQLKWHSFGAHLHSSVATSLNSDAFTDVSLFTTDGHQINAHRFVLATCSQYLQQIFKLQTKVVTNLPLIVIMPPEITYKTLKTLIQYMYCGETTVSNDILENVLRGGDILQVRGLWRPRNESQTTTKSDKDKNTLSKTPVKVVQNKTSSVLKTVDSNVKTPEIPDKLQKPEEVPIPKPIEQPVIKSENLEEENQKSDKEINNTNNQSDKDSDKNSETTEKNKDDVNYIVIKEEPIEWNEFEEVEMSENEMFHSEMTIKPEIIFPNDDSDYRPESEEMYSPLTCELCSETYTLPAEWVRHIRTHTDMQPAKRRRGGRPLVEDDDNFPPLQCDLCQKQFPTPGEWVRHIQNTHTDTELAESNHSSGSVSGSSKPRILRTVGVTHKTCTICNKKFPSHASMLIHRRTHTGERPFVCDFCQKGFNVKSNLLRHLRTLHDKIINSSDVNPDQ